MHGGTSTGWSGWIEEPVPPSPSHGRHRDPGSPPPARPEAAHAPAAETDPTGGLHKFDLGTVPASVTPPRTWRRAAWFAVTSSAAALGGLMVATVALMGSSSTSLQGWGPPDMPRGGEYPPLPSGLSTVRTTGPTSSRSIESWPSSPDDVQAGRLPGAAVAPPFGAPSATGRPRPSGLPPREPSPEAPGDGSKPPDSGQHVPGTERPPTSSAPPTTSTPSPPPRSPSGFLPLFTDAAIEQRTEEYFAAVSRGELHRAYALTTGALREEGFASFASRYADATSIEVVGTDARDTSTVTTLRVTRGRTVTTQRRELRFTTDDDPLVEADVPAS